MDNYFGYPTISSACKPRTYYFSMYKLLHPDIVKQFKIVNGKFKVKIRTISSLYVIGAGVKISIDIWNLHIIIFFIPSAAVQN